MAMGEGLSTSIILATAAADVSAREGLSTSILATAAADVSAWEGLSTNILAAAAADVSAWEGLSTNILVAAAADVSAWEGDGMLGTIGLLPCGSLLRRGVNRTVGDTYDCTRRRFSASHKSTQWQQHRIVGSKTIHETKRLAIHFQKDQSTFKKTNPLSKRPIHLQEDNT
jgi:hypothetical protein